MTQRKILLALSNTTELQLVTDMLSTEYEVEVWGNENSPNYRNKKYDLVLVDAYYGKQWCPFLQDEKKSNLVFLPVLLLLPDKEPATPWLNRCFDDIIRMPLSKEELKVRVNAFLKLRKQSEKILAHSEETYRAIFEATGTATLIVNADTSIQMANRECFEIFGYTKEELKGQSWTKYASPESLELMIKNHRLRRENPELAPEKYEVKIMHKDGTPRNVILDVGIIPGTGQSVVSMLDITEQKQADISLRESEERFRKLFEDHVAVQLQIDPETGRLLDANPAAESFYGWTREELKQKTIFDLNCYPREEVIRGMQRAKSAKQTDFEWKHRLKNGEIKHVKVFSSKITHKDQTFLHSIIFDITAGKQAETALAESEKKYRTLQQNIPGMAYRARADWSAEIISGSEDLCGYSPKDFSRGHVNWEELVHPDDRRRIIDETSYNGKKKKQLVQEYRITTKTKAIKWVEDYKTIFYDRKGMVTGVDGIIFDVTERRRSEQQLKTLIKAIEQSPLSIVITDSKGKIEFVNKKFTAITQYLFSQVEGKKPRVFNPGHMIKKQFEEMWSKIREGGIWEGEFYNRRKDGTYYWESVTISSITDSKGKISNYIVVMEDITEWRRTELQLKLLSRSVEQSPVSVMITNKDGYFTYVNPKFEEVTGYKMEEVMGKTPRILKSGEHPQEFYKELWDTILAGKEWVGEFRNKRKNGELYWDNSIISPIVNTRNEITHFVAVQQDITRDKELLQELIKAKEKAEESDRLKSAFLTNMSHEIRTPMNGIMGFLELLKDPDLGSETRREFIDIVNKSGQRLLNTINDIIEISKIEAGSIEVHSDRVNLSELLREHYLFFKPIAIEKGLQLTLNVPESAVIIHSDKTKLDSIVTNLVNNAVKFTNQGQINLELKVEDERIRLTVKDTGRGIKPENLDKIFGRFMQEDIAFNRGYEGSGLGLAITRSYTEMLGGKIHVESEPGKGSTFCVEFNNTKLLPAITEPVEMPEKFSNTGDFTLLIAEDDDISFQYLDTVLSGHHFNLFRAKNGEEAVTICRENSDIDLVLMDIQMPLMNGYQATREILKFRPGLPVIAQTAYAFPSDRQKALECGCVDYVAKPISKDELLEKIVRHMRN